MKGLKYELKGVFFATALISFYLASDRPAVYRNAPKEIELEQFAGHIAPETRKTPLYQFAWDCSTLWSGQDKQLFIRMLKEAKDWGVKPKTISISQILKRAGILFCTKLVINGIYIYNIVTLYLQFSVRSAQACTNLAESACEGECPVM